MVAEVVVNVAEAVPGLGRTELVVDRGLQLERVLTEADGRVVVLEQGLEPADRVEQFCLPGLVFGRPEQLKRLLGVAERLSVAILALAGPGLGGLDVGPADTVIRLP